MIVLAFSLGAASPDPIGIPSLKPADKKSNFLKISGEIGTYGELYSISGRERRRPSDTARIYFRPTLSLMDNFTINFNLFLSTEGSSARQDINEIDINPKWGWGEAHIVDFTESYSNFTLNGIKVRGASLNLTPGIFRASVISGISRNEVSSSSAQPVYRRQLRGGRIGIGREGESSFDIIVISSKDDISSVGIAVPDTSVEADSSEYSGEQNPESITPQENLVGALLSGISFAESRVSWKNEFSASAITRDRRSALWEQKGYPEFLKGIFNPRLSSSIDFAFSSELRVNLNKNNIQIGYQRIGPGYVSLGLASQSNDKQVVKIGLNRRFRAGTVKLDLSRQNDNLISQKLFTTVRNSVNTGFAIRPLDKWSLNLNVAYTTMKNDADSTSKIDFTNWVFRLNNTLNYDRKRGLTNVSLDYSLQTAGDSNPARISSSMDSHTIGLRSLFRVKEGLNVSPSLNIVASRQADAGWTTTSSLTLASDMVSMNKKLSNGIQLNIGFDKTSTSFKPGLRSSYKLTPAMTASLQLEMRNVSSKSEAGDFRELTSRLTISNRF